MNEEPKWVLAWIGHAPPTLGQIAAAKRQGYTLVPIDIPDPLSVTADDVAKFDVAKLPNFEGVATHSQSVSCRLQHRYQVFEFRGTRIEYHDGRYGTLKGTPYP